jgi:hypothetical protein
MGKFRAIFSSDLLYRNFFDFRNNPPWGSQRVYIVTMDGACPVTGESIDFYCKAFNIPRVERDNEHKGYN